MEGILAGWRLIDNDNGQRPSDNVPAKAWIEDQSSRRRLRPQELQAHDLTWNISQERRLV